MAFGKQDEAIRPPGTEPHNRGKSSKWASWVNGQLKGPNRGGRKMYFVSLDIRCAFSVDLIHKKKIVMTMLST